MTASGGDRKDHRLFWIPDLRPGSAPPGAGVRIGVIQSFSVIRGRFSVIRGPYCASISPSSTTSTNRTNSFR